MISDKDSNSLSLNVKDKKVGEKKQIPVREKTYQNRPDRETSHIKHNGVRSI